MHHEFRPVAVLSRDALTVPSSATLLDLPALGMKPSVALVPFRSHSAQSPYLPQLPRTGASTVTYEPPFILTTKDTIVRGREAFACRWAQNELDLQKILPGLPRSSTHPEAELSPMSVNSDQITVPIFVPMLIQNQSQSEQYMYRRNAERK